ncbi:alpha/beta hydrolase [Winogradskya humida]|uniref:Hydrolase n=1 Tax=Winogradskya humida TaxID=113566 RepID=A0ABQ4A6C6_9ACTN|nr:alpha/beta hydrolase [Actinoplanes humidus]GIE26391.1 hydrolase [Actinoplanes humidus]
MTHPDRTAAPLPTSISEAARQYLALPPTEPTTYPALDETDGWLKLIEATDAGVAQFLAGYTFPVASDLREISGVNTYVLRADGVPDSDNTPIYLNLHGGGLILGGGELCRAMGSVAAMYSGMITWSVDYRMPPLHPYPAALDDCIAVYRALLEVRDPADIFVGGGSAGGNLAAALIARAKDEGLPMPAALVLSTPEADLTESGDTFQTLDGVHTGLRSLMPVNLLYANGHPLTDPYLSPLFADLTGFPPTFLQSGTRDLFLSNTIRMHRKLLAAGVEAELHVFEAMPHGGFGGTTPEDAELNAAIRGFLDKHRRTA